MLDIHVYGKLRRHIRPEQISEGSVVRISPRPDETVKSLLKNMGVPESEVYSIFLNSKLLAARSGMARWIGYQQVRPNPFDWNLGIRVNAGDRIGLFGRDMAALVI